MEDQSYTPRVQEEVEELQLHRQVSHPAPSPVPYSPQLPPPYSHSPIHARRHHSAKANHVSDTLRRRSVQQEDASVSSDIEASLRLSLNNFSGLEMPSTKEDPVDTGSTGMGDHLLPHNYTFCHANAGVHHKVNTQDRLYQSPNNINGSPKHYSHFPQHQKSSPAKLQGETQSHSYAQANRHINDEDNGSLAIATITASSSQQHSRRPRSSFTPQHQLDRRNSRRRVTDQSSRTTNNTSSLVPNRYYLAGKSVQTEWSSPTRQRRSRSTLNHHHLSTSSHHQKPKSKSALADSEKHHDSNTHSTNHSHPSNNNHIIVLPSISIPNGNHDDYRQCTHPSQIKPPAFPQRRACVQATSIVCSFGTFKWCVIVQIVLVIPLCLYVFDAHAQKKHAKQQLQQYNEEHEHILNQMMWMDQAAKKIKTHHKHSNMKHNKMNYLDADAADTADADPYFLSNEQYQNPLDLVLAAGNNNENNPDDPNNNFFENYRADSSATDDLRDSVHKLRGQMRDMQYRIQQNSKARITEKYGEGPIRVYLHPEPEDPILVAAAAGPAGMPPQEMTSEIALELFVEDTPHAVSTFLYQIERGHWNRVQMNWKSDTSILSKPGGSVTTGMGDWMQTSRLEFLEQFPIKHCEVALVQEGQLGVLSLQVNLVEVPFKDQEEVCIGRLLNDRLILPKARGYFMAEFATTSNSATKRINSKPQFEQRQQQILALTPPPQESPPPHVEEQERDGENLKAEGDKVQKLPFKQQRLRGQVEDEEVDPSVGHQLVSPLPVPEDAPGDRY